jgi:hypothetical protein
VLDRCEAFAILVKYCQVGHADALPVAVVRTTMRSLVSLSMCGILLVGCAQPARVSDSLSLKDGEGVILYRMSCGPHVAWGEFFRSGEGSAGFFAGLKRAGALLCQEGVQSQRLKAGRYYVGKIGYTSWVNFAEIDAMSFTVAPGKLNYIGHIQLPSNATRDGGRTLVLISDPVVIDKSAEAEAWLTTEQSLLRKYEFIKALAQASAKLGKQRPAADSENTN